MIQKLSAKRRVGMAAAIICIVGFCVPSALAQELPMVGAASVDVDKNAGMPIDAIISAAADGGLSASQNLADVKPEVVPPPTADAPVSPDPVPAPPNPTGFNADSIDYLESQGGLSTNPQVNASDGTIFKLAITFFEKVVFRKDVQFANRPTFSNGMDISGAPTFDKDTAGYAIIKKGNQSVFVDFDQVYDSPPVVTASLSLEQYDDPDVRAAAEDLLLVSDVKYIVANVTKKSFEVMMDHKADSDIPFSWHALAVKDPKTFKKKGESLDNGAVSGSDKSSSPTNSTSGAKRSPAASGPAAVGQSSSSAVAPQADGAAPQDQANSINNSSGLNP